jgi:hypothetical protein
VSNGLNRILPTSAAKLSCCERIEANASAHPDRLSSSGELSAVAYTMVAERDDQKVKKERTSALIVLANARVWESEGWQVMITDPEGKEFDPAAFEKVLGPGYTWSRQEPLVSLLPQEPLAVLSTQDLSPQEIEPSAEAAALNEAAYEEGEYESESWEAAELELDEPELSDDEPVEHEPSDLDEESAESHENWAAA